MPSPDPNPNAEYQLRLEKHKTERDRLKQIDTYYIVARLVTFAALVGVLLAFVGLQWPFWSLILAVVIFVGTLALHGKLIERQRRTDQAIEFYERGLARLAREWARIGVAGTHFADPDHPYSGDLDIFGPASLFALTSIASTPVGEQTLAGWLSAPAELKVIRARQAAIEELKPKLDLREDVAVLGRAVRRSVRIDRLITWGKGSDDFELKGLRVLAIVLPAIMVAALISWPFTPLGPIPFGAALVAVLIYGRIIGKKIGGVESALDRSGRSLRHLADVLGVFEKESFAAPRLIELQEQLKVEDKAPSECIARLGLLTDLLDDARGNLAAALFGTFFLWRENLALGIEAWRRKHGDSIEGWLNALGEIEALSSLGSYAFEHPEDVFPELVESTDRRPLFVAEQIGHPLLPDGDRICNDITIDDAHRLYIISGSNMSGKSTFLRTIGVNAALAQAGGVVHARALRMCPIQVASSVRIQDSLQAGISHFYAEIKRLRQIVDHQDGDLPLLFMLDEILHGTNSHDRRIGADAVIRKMVAGGAAGLVTTHDLALAKIAEEIESAHNVHFEDHLEKGRMEFDYKLREGIVKKSNALELMRAVGLDV